MLELVAKKIGMTHKFEEEVGASIPLTMVKLYDNCILDLKVNENKAFNSLLVAFEKEENPKKLPKPQAGIFKKKSVPLFKKIHGSKVSKAKEYKVGESLEIESLLKEGDKLSVSGTSIGKGFAGGMKRWGFGGLEATHGISISHRSHGSTGQCQDPGKTFKGKKMAGHMGSRKVTVKNLEVVMIDKENSVVALKGAVPGHSGSDILLKIA